MKTQQLTLPNPANNQTTVNFNVQPAKNLAQRPVNPAETTKDQSFKKLEAILPEKVSKAFSESGFTGALNAIQNELSDKELVSFAKTIEEVSGKELPKSAAELKKTFQSPDFAPAFISSFKSAFKAAKENPQAVLADPKEFVRSELAKLSQDPTKAIVQNRQAQETAPAILKFPSARAAAETLAKNAA